MPWWGWIVVGAILLGSELFFIEAEFFLVFIGLSAAATGLAVLGFPGLAPWLQWLLFAALALGSMALFRRRVYQKLRTSPDRRGLPGPDPRYGRHHVAHRGRRLWASPGRRTRGG